MTTQKWILGVLLLLSLPLAAQTDVLLSQHMFNRMDYNPAVTGASRYVNVTVLNREQWIGWEGAPRSRMVTVHNFFDAISSGFGLILSSDRIGYENSMNFSVSYAYHVQLSGSSYLSLGLSAGILYRTFDFDRVNPNDYTDGNLSLLGLEEKTVPDFDFGVEFNTGKFTVGLSTTHLTQKDDEHLLSGRHYYLFAKYMVSVNSHWKIVPSLFVQANRTTGHAEVNVQALLDDRYWAGISYRVNDRFVAESFVPMLGMDITKHVRLGYSYDFNLANLGTYSHGTHELLLSVRIPKKSARYSRSPRFFE